MSHAPVVDDLLPAAPFLTSDAAAGVLAAALAAAGSELVDCTPVQVHYRPGSEVVVRYRVDERGADGRVARTTVLAGTSPTGAPAGTLPIEAVDDDGNVLQTGVWRWPFDPVLVGLGRAVTPSTAAELLGDQLTAPLTLEVVVYRPTERAVVRATGTCGTTVYIKVVDPACAPDLAERHRVLGRAGLPVPAVVAVDRDAGLVALAELAGPTLRDVVKNGGAALPGPAAFLELRRRLAATPLAPSTRSTGRRGDARFQAAVLAAVLPSRVALLGQLLDWLDAAPCSPETATIHGDLHEGQLIVSGAHIVGLLDIDDVGPGDALDDLATTLGHLRFRAAVDTTGRADELHRYADRLRRGFVAEVDANELDATTVAVLIGLATGPFRVQSPGWAAATDAVLDTAERIMRQVSDSRHRPATRLSDADLVGTTADV